MTEKKIDHLSEDPKLTNQLWCCVSFLSPEGIKNCKIRGVKIRGCFPDEESANAHAKELQALDPDFHVFVGEVGKWLAWDPDPSSAGDEIYREEQLQNLMAEYKKNRSKAKVMEEQRRRELVEENVRRESERLSARQVRMRKKVEEKKTQDNLENLKKIAREPTKSENIKEKENLALQEKNRLVQNEVKLQKASDGLATIDEKLNHLQKMYKELSNK